MAKVSIIVPVYNGATYIVETITSVLQQTCSNYEIIVVDDGSTDETATILASFGNAVRYIYQENGGVSSARNNGIHLARGDYVVILDADDLLKPTYLEEMLTELKQDTDIDAVYCGFQYMDAMGQLLPQIENRVVCSENLFDALLDGNFLAPHTVLAKKKCYEDAGMFDELLMSSEDSDMWLRMAKQCRMVGISKVLALYRVHNSSKSSDPDRMLKYRLQVLAKHFGPNDGKSNQWSHSKRRAYASRYLWSAIGYFQTGEISKGRDCLRQTFIIDPTLSQSPGAFYELALANQPKGWRGDLRAINIEDRVAGLLENLNSLYQSDNGTPVITIPKSFVYGNAYYAVAMLAEQSDNWLIARRYMLLAMKHRPAMVLSPTFIRRLFKLLAGQRVAQQLTKLKTVT